MLLPDVPYIQLLLAAAAAMDPTVVDYADLAGVLEPVTVRHAFSRKPVRSEKPALSLIFVDDDNRNDDINLNAWETARVLQFDIQADIDTYPEDSGLDSTGLAKISRLIAAAVYGMKAETSPLMPLIDGITIGAVGPDDKSQSENVRLVRAVSVLYRVRADDENVLLAAGVNAS